jgi:hypothetical protein
MKMVLNPITGELDYVSEGVIGVGKPFITDITSSGGVVGRKKYEEDTIPNNLVLTECTLDGTSATIHFIVQGAADKYSPTVVVNGVECLNLQELPDEKRFFFGSVLLSNLIEDTTITVSTDIGQNSSAIIYKASDPPVLSFVSFVGEYPGIQTEVKEDDPFDIEYSFEDVGEPPAFLEIQDFGACQFNMFPISELSGVITSTIRQTGNTKQSLSAKVRGVNSFGTPGVWVETNNTVDCNDLAPSFIDNGVVYPNDQQAFKGNEIGYQETIVNNASTFEYSSPNDDFTISYADIYEQVKTLQLNNPTHYNDSIENFMIVANRIENDSTSVFLKNIEVANTAPIVSIQQPVSRLRSSESGEIYTIAVVSDQKLLATPEIGIPVSGTWQGFSFIGSGKFFSRQILITDVDAKGIGDWTFSTITNRAGIVANVSGTQNVGGFVSRQIPLPAFMNSADLTTAVVDTSKLLFSWSFKDNMFFTSIGTNAPIVRGWTIDNILLPTTKILILDTQATSASSKESIITIEESI